MCGSNPGALAGTAHPPWASQMAKWIKNLLANAGDTGDTGLIPGSGRSWRRAWLQYPCLENPMDRGDWWVTVHTVAKTWT